MACKEPNKFFPVRKSPVLPAGALKGKVAFVTGGGTGLGRAMATLFAQLGARVAIAARRMEVLEKTAQEIRQQTGAEVVAIHLDVKNPAEVAKAADECVSKLGLPNIVVNNAAGNFIMATERLSPNAFRTVFDIVLIGTANVTLEFGRRMIEAKQGCSFLSITTPYARSGAPFVVPSATAKAGVENMVRSLASEWGKYGMRFNCIAPGPIPTEGAFGRLNPNSMDDASAAAGLTVPVGRVGEPEELANLAAFVVSDYGSWLNGSIIDFDGGQQFLGNGAGFTKVLHEKSPEDWAQIEALIRGRTGKSKM